jgi:hypothetical protein
MPLDESMNQQLQTFEMSHSTSGEHAHTCIAEMAGSSGALKGLASANTSSSSSAQQNKVLSA